MIEISPGMLVILILFVLFLCSDNGTSPPPRGYQPKDPP